MIVNDKILSATTGEPVKLMFAMVGKGKAVHYSPSNDETLCGKGISSYVDGSGDAPLCKRCGTVERKRSAEYAEWLNARETDAESVSEGVEIQGEEPSNWTPDVQSITSATQCFYGCGRPVTGAFTDYVGKTEGVCDFDRSHLAPGTLVVPVDPSVWGGAPNVGNVATVCVVQNTPGMAGRSHYHAPECRDIAREMKRYGQSTRDVMEMNVSDVAEILAFEYGDIASDNYESGTHEWWTSILENAQVDMSDGNGFGVRVMPCLSIPMGNAGIADLVMVNGEYRLSLSKGTHKLRFYAETEKGYVYECTQCRSTGSPRYMASFLCDVSTTMDERMTMVHRGASLPSCDYEGAITGAPVSMVAAELSCPQCRALVTPTIVHTSRVHAFDSTVEAYNASQCSEDVKDGDVLVVPSESAVAILVQAWPMSVTDSHGEFHWSADKSIEAVLNGVAISDGSDYSVSLRMARSVLSVMENVPDVQEEHVFNLCDVPECADCSAILYAECQAKHTGDKPCAACELLEEMNVNAEDDAPQGDVSPVFECYGENGSAVHVGECSQAKGVNGPVCSIDDDGTDANDAGFVETIVTMDYRLSVIVDERTGATVDLGWITLDMNAAQAHDDARIADAYGAAHGTGTPRYGWESIIIVHEVCAV